MPDTFAYGPGNPFGNPVTANRLAPSLHVCAVNPGAGNPCPTANLRTLFTGEPVRILPSNNAADEFITRGDFNPTDKDVLSIRYIYNSSRFPIATGRAVAGALFDVPSENNNLGASYTRNVSTNWTNEARFNYSRLNVRFGDPEGDLPGPQITFSGARDLVGNFVSLATGTPTNLPQSRKVVVYQEQDTLIGTVGNHALKFGFDLRQQRTENFFLPTFLGAYTFRGTSASGTVPAGTFYNSNGVDRSGAVATAFENFLLNRPRDINFAVGNPSFNVDQDDYFFFIQDDWRALSNLTLNLGLRYEISTQPFNPLIEALNERESDPSTSLFNQAFGLETRTLDKVPLDKNNFGPRVGFAWSPNFDFLGDRFTNGRTVIRGGIGVSYDPGFFNIVLNTTTAAPFAASGFIRQNDPGAPGSVGIPFLPTTTAQLNQTPGTNGGDPRLFNQTRVADNLHNPYTISYNLGVQQELWKNAVLEVRYVGSLIRDQFQTVNANPDLRALASAGQALFGDPTRFTNGTMVTPYTGPGAIAPTPANGFNTRGTDAGVRITGSGRLDPNFGPIRLRTNGAEGRYDGLQTEFRTRLSDLALNVNYTFSKTLDNASEIFSSFAGGQGVATAQNPFDTVEGERGLSAFHQKHTFTANFVYDVPFYRSQKNLAGKLLGGFQLNGIVRIGSGQPYTPVNVVGAVDAGFESAFLAAASTLRPFGGNPNAPEGTIAFGYTAACGALFGGPECDYNGGGAVPGTFIVFNTLNAGSVGTVVTADQVRQQARLIYNDFGLVNSAGFSLASLEAFQLFRTPFGDVGRNTLIGEPSFLVDLALIKTTNIGERLKIEFRAEATNVLNRRNFGVPTAFTEAASTGFTVGSFQNPGFNNGGSRAIRLGAKFVF